MWIFQIVRCCLAKGRGIGRKFTAEYLVKSNPLYIVHRSVCVDDFLGKGRLRRFATLREQVPAQKPHVFPAAASQYRKEYIEECWHCDPCIPCCFVTQRPVQDCQIHAVQSGNGSFRVSCAKGIISRPSPKAIAVYATGLPILPT